MEEQKSAQQQSNIQTVLDSLKIRTMAGDLKRSSQPSSVPAPAAPAKPLATASKPKAEAPPVKLFKQTFLQAKEALTQKRYEETINLAQKVVQDKTASWFTSFKAKRIIRQATEAIEKQQKLNKEILPPPAPKIPTPKQTYGTIAQTPLHYAPSETLAIESKEVSGLKPPLPPTPTQISQPAPAPSHHAPAFLPKPAPQPVMTGVPQPKIKYQEPISPQPETVKKTKTSNRLGWVFGALIFLGLAGTAGYFYLTGNFPWPTKPVCQEGEIAQSCRCQDQIKESGFCCDNLWLENDCIFAKPPVPLIKQANELIVIEAKDADYDKIISDIKEAGQSINQESAKLIALKMGESPVLYATPDQLIDAFGIVLPAQIKDNTQAFNLILYVKPALADQEKEIRLLLVLKQKDILTTGESLIQWEQTMLDDMKPIILGQAGEPATPDFQSCEYHGAIFRYKNLPVKTTTINYTLYKDLLILGTSKNSIYYTFDLASGQTQNQ